MRTLLLATLVLTAGCDCGDDEECESADDCSDRLGCVDHQCAPCAEDADCGGDAVCDLGTDGEPGCYEAVVVRGVVFDLADGAPIGGARVVAVDANGAPASSVAVTEPDGSYELGIPSIRTAEGAPEGAQITLRADAQGYQTFPDGIRQALPIDTTDAADLDDDGDDQSLVVAGPLTEIGLVALGAGAGTASIHGAVELSEDAPFGTLVVAEDESGVGATAIADLDGDYAIFNLAAGEHVVQGYAQGVNYTAQTVTLAAGDDTEVNLALSDAPTATFSSGVTFANADANETSIIMVVESTFDEDLARGSVPPGLRAPEPGIAPNVSGAFTIEGVPDGRYVVLAAFENDRLVRDPDPCIAGTDIVHVEFAGGALVGDAPDQFKVTGAIAVVGPGATEPEPVTTAPTLEWEDDPSAEWYIVTVRDALGELVWGETRVEDATGQDVAYDGPLDPGMVYQFKVVSWREHNNEECAISSTEDLKGVFFVPTDE